MPLERFIEAPIGQAAPTRHSVPVVNPAKHGLAHAIEHLQRSIGNRRVAALIRAGQISSGGLLRQQPAGPADRVLMPQLTAGPTMQGAGPSVNPALAVGVISSSALRTGPKPGSASPNGAHAAPKKEDGKDVAREGEHQEEKRADTPKETRVAPLAAGVGGDEDPAHRLVQVAGGVSRSAADRLQRAPNSQPTMSQGRIGEVVVPLPDWEFLDQKSFTKTWSKKLDDTSLLKIPIPDLGVRVDLSASASANASFVASLGPGKLRNIRLGLTKTQAAVLAAGALMGGEIEDMALLYLLPKLAVLGFNDLRALADLDIPASVSLHLGAMGTLKAAALAAGLFEVAMLAASLEATASADLPVKLGGPVGLYLENGKLDVKYHQSLDAQLNLAFSLIASLQAKLLGFHWSKSWKLASANLGHTWKLGTVANVGYDGGPKADMAMNEDNKDGALPGWLTDILNAAQSAQQLQSLLQPGPGGGAPGAPGGGAPGGSGPAASAPGGRSDSDPIDMIWFKNPGLYPKSVTLGQERIFFTEPDYVVVPDDPGLADIRRNADTNGRIRIGVSPNSKFYPRVGNIWPRVSVGPVRGGTNQRQFRRLLTALGYQWGTQEADHVRDLQWRGEDAYENLWPLEEVHNGAGNDVLAQMVTYRDSGGVVRTVPLGQTPLNLHFKIIGYSGSAAHPAAGGGASGGGGAAGGAGGGSGSGAPPAQTPHP